MISTNSTKPSQGVCIHTAPQDACGVTQVRPHPGGGEGGSYIVLPLLAQVYGSAGILAISVCTEVFMCLLEAYLQDLAAWHGLSRERCVLHCSEDLLCC